MADRLAIIKAKPSLRIKVLMFTARMTKAFYSIRILNKIALKTTNYILKKMGYKITII